MDEISKPDSEELLFRMRQDVEKAKNLILEEIQISLTNQVNPGPFFHGGKLYLHTDLWKIQELAHEAFVITVSLALIWATIDGIATINPLPGSGRPEGFGPNYNLPHLITLEFWTGFRPKTKTHMIALKIGDARAEQVIELLLESLPKLDWISKTEPFLEKEPE